MTSREGCRFFDRLDWWDALADVEITAIPDDGLTQEIAAAYYDDELSFEHLKALVGAEEAATRRVLKQQLAENFIDGVADV